MVHGLLKLRLRCANKADEWFTQEVIADGDFIVIKVNGRITAAFVDKNRTYTKGHLAIQHLNPDTVIQVRQRCFLTRPSTSLQSCFAPSAHSG
jgi:hypothetical protein